MIERIYHPYWKWEETYTNMWKAVEDREEWLRRAVDFTGNASLYGKWMLDVIDEWPISCEHNLSNLTQNRKAWIGHAACALAFNCPEDIVREAWGKLTELQQRAANREAQKAIDIWESKYVQERIGNQRHGSGPTSYSLDL